MTFCHFVNYDLGVAKEWTTEKGDFDFEMVGGGSGCTLTLGAQKTFRQSLPVCVCVCVCVGVCVCVCTCMCVTKRNSF